MHDPVALDKVLPSSYFLKARQDFRTIVAGLSGLYITLGQRRGTEVALGAKAYVSSIRPDGDVVITADPQDLLSDDFDVDDVRLMPAFRAGLPDGLQARVRYRSEPVPCGVERSGSTSLRVNLRRPVRAVTPGQVAVFYAGDEVVAGGWIRRGSRQPFSSAGGDRLRMVGVDRGALEGGEGGRRDGVRCSEWLQSQFPVTIPLVSSPGEPDDSAGRTQRAATGPGVRRRVLEDPPLPGAVGRPGGDPVRVPSLEIRS